MATQQDLDNINAVLASAARSVTMGDATVIYNTGDTLLRLRDDIQKQLNAEAEAARPTRRSRQTYIYQSGRGYD